jgi:hypothetical protein
MLEKLYKNIDDRDGIHQHSKENRKSEAKKFLYKAVIDIEEFPFKYDSIHNFSANNVPQPAGFEHAIGYIDELDKKRARSVSNSA